MNLVGVTDYTKILHDGTTSDVWLGLKDGKKVVVKVSDDRSYYKAALRVWQYPSPLISKVVYTSHLPSNYDYWSRKVISVEEYLDKLPEPQVQVLDELRRKQIANSPNRRTSITPQRLAKLAQSLRDPIEKKILAERLVPISISLQKRGMVWFDFHGGNIMLRRRAWVMSDLGFCWVRARCLWTDGTAQPTPLPKYCW